MNNKYIRLYLDIQQQQVPAEKNDYQMKSLLLKNLFGITISAEKIKRIKSFKKIIYKKLIRINNNKTTINKVIRKRNK